MKFLKNNLKVIIAFILGLILAGGIVYAAVSAKEVTYSTDKNTEIKNVEEALNDLYNKQKNYVSPTGNINIEENGEYDVTRYALADVNIIPQSAEIIYQSSTEGTETYTIKESDVEKYSMLFVVLASGNDTVASTTQTFSSTANLNKLLDNTYTTNGYGRLWLSIGYVTDFSQNDTITMFSWFAAQKRICGILK